MTTVMHGLVYRNLNSDEKRLLTEGRTCAICDTSELQLVVDHCHTNGFVRGIVCGPCNLRLGWIDALTVQWVTRAGEYLGNHRSCHAILRVVENNYESKNEAMLTELRTLEAKAAELDQSIRRNKERMAKIKGHLKR